MKTNLMFLALLIAIGVFAQGPRRSPEERAKMAMEKIAEFKLDNDKQVQADSAFTQFYRAQSKAFQELRESGQPIDRDKMREKTEGLRTERDDKLKKIFTEQQFKKWKEEIEPSLNPRPQQ